MEEHQSAMTQNNCVVNTNAIMSSSMIQIPVTGLFLHSSDQTADVSHKADSSR